MEDVGISRQKLERLSQATDELKEVGIRNLRPWPHGSNLGIMKFEIPVEFEPKVRNTVDQFRAAWYPLRVDYIPTALVRNSLTGLWSTTVPARLRQENNVEVMYAKPLTG